MASRVAECCAALGRAFARVPVRWFLFGAQAAILRGARRFTADIDVTVDPADHPMSAIVDGLAREGVMLRMADSEEFIAATRVLPMRHEASGYPVDVVLAGPGFEERFFERLSVIEIDGVSIPTARAEDLVVMKVLAGRPLDQEDVVAIIAANELDDESIRADLRELEALLDQRDLVRSYDAACRRASAARGRRG